LYFLKLIPKCHPHCGFNCTFIRVIGILFKLNWSVSSINCNWRLEESVFRYMVSWLQMELLRFISNIVCAFSVGHCHPYVVSVGQEQMGKLTTSNGFLSDSASQYAKRLVETLPENLCVCYFVNSG
jgi:hypothetical protein